MAAVQTAKARKKRVDDPKLASRPRQFVPVNLARVMGSACEIARIVVGPAADGVRDLRRPLDEPDLRIGADRDARARDRNSHWPVEIVIRDQQLLASHLHNRQLARLVS